MWTQPSKARAHQEAGQACWRLAAPPVPLLRQLLRLPRQVPLKQRTIASQRMHAFYWNPADGGTAQGGDFVRRNGTQLELGGAPFRFMGVLADWAPCS